VPLTEVQNVITCCLMHFLLLVSRLYCAKDCCFFMLPGMFNFSCDDLEVFTLDLACTYVLLYMALCMIV